MTVFNRTAKLLNNTCIKCILLYFRFYFICKTTCVYR